MQTGPELRPLLQDVEARLAKPEGNLLELRDSLERLLKFLSSDEGGSEDNCKSAEAFFFRRWTSRDWGSLPEAYVDILNELASMLHDAVSAPTIAKNFEATPEQLLYRVRRLPI